jgi:hypothetical protein
MILVSRKPWYLQNRTQAQPSLGRAPVQKEFPRNPMLKPLQLQIILSLVQTVFRWGIRNRLVRFSAGYISLANLFSIDSSLQILQKILNQAAVKRPHRFLGQAAHLLRSPILLQVLAILGKGLQLPTTCITQSQPR